MNGDRPNFISYVRVIKNFPTPRSSFHTSHSSIDTNMAILLAALKTVAEEVNLRAAPAGREPRDPLNVLSCTLLMRSKLYPNYLIENRNRESKYMVTLLIGTSEV